jgi:hypothetical protein
MSATVYLVATRFLSTLIGCPRWQSKPIGPERLFDVVSHAL